MRKVVKGMASIAALVVPVVALAAGNAGGPNPVPDSPIKTISGALQLLCRIFAWLFTFFIVIAVIFVLLAAWKYLTAAGDADKVKSANQSLIYAAVAVGVALIAKGVPTIVSTLMGGQDITAC
ncbi:hypothetical protein D6779_12150 [Candidatus Parcubacteria bacterium]|nr:MAG: hypothetical protein D6779_12150 [Candidatus Parcubacteria bacterium]